MNLVIFLSAAAGLMIVVMVAVAMAASHCKQKQAGEELLSVS